MSYKTIFLETFYVLYSYRWRIAQGVVIPFTVFLAIDFFAAKEESPTLFFLLSSLSLAAFVVLAVNIHRLLLLGPGSIPKYGILFWSKLEVTFLLRALALFLLMMPVAFLALIPTVGGVLALGVMGYLLARLSFTFPAIAIGESGKFSKSWQLTQDHQLLMFVVLAVFPVILAVPGFMLDLLIDIPLILNVFGALILIYQIAAISVAFKFATVGKLKLG